MSISIPPLLFGFAYSRLGRNGSRDVDLNTSGVPMRPASICRFRRRIAGVEPPHESHLEEHAGPRDGVLHRRDLAERERRRLFAERRLAARRRRQHELPVRVRRRDDHHRVHRRVVDERERVRIVARDVELRRHLLCERRQRIGDRDEPRFRDAARQIARVDAAQAAESNQSHCQAASSFHVVLRHELELHLDFCRDRLAPDHLDGAFHGDASHLGRETAPPRPPSCPPQSPSSHRRARRSR